MSRSATINRPPAPAAASGNAGSMPKARTTRPNHSTAQMAPTRLRSHGRGGVRTPLDALGDKRAEHIDVIAAESARPGCSFQADHQRRDRGLLDQDLLGDRQGEAKDHQCPPTDPALADDRPGQARPAAPDGELDWKDEYRAE